MSKSESKTKFGVMKIHGRYFNHRIMEDYQLKGKAGLESWVERINVPMHALIEIAEGRARISGVTPDLRYETIEDGGEQS